MNYTGEKRMHAAMAVFIESYNDRRFHEGIGNLTPPDVYCGRWEEILRQRREQKRQTLSEQLHYNL